MDRRRDATHEIREWRVVSGGWTRQALALTIPSMRATILLLVLAAASAGCGYRGPLTLPKPKPEAQKPAPKPATEPAEKKTPGDQ